MTPEKSVVQKHVKMNHGKILIIIYKSNIVNFGDYPGQSVSVNDTATNTIVSTVKVNGEPGGVAITQDGENVYVVNGGKPQDIIAWEKVTMLQALSL